MSMKKPLGLILAGGQSKRLFPVTVPKPLLKVNGISLLEQSIRRLKGFDVYIVTNAQIAEEIRKAFRADRIKIPSFIIEPEGRDTAAAVGYGIRMAEKKRKHPWVAVLSADQWMPDDRNFSKFLKNMQSEIQKFPDALFVGGSSASTKAPHSHSQFGWIAPQRTEKNSSAVKKFVEKPKGTLLQKMRKSKALINAGMFFGRPEVFLKAYQKFYPEILSATPKNYYQLKRQPIDRAIFENYSKVRVIALPMRWEDLGTWEDWFTNVGTQVSTKNSVKSKKMKVSTGAQIRCKKVLISADEDFEIFGFDLEDLAIIQSGSKLLVMPLSKTRDLKNYLENL
ncbi:MAG: NTP transferase domain-containing protein [Deltaproteobacteria bacterium]|nr:NTP transferase domain-containing protein [Deltaproteobacteria bacterium]